MNLVIHDLSMYYYQNASIYLHPIATVLLKQSRDMPIPTTMVTLAINQYKQMHWTTKLRHLLRFRLARRLSLVVFGSIVMIEFIIVIPSYNNFKASQFVALEQLARVTSSTALAGRMPDDNDLTNEL